MDYTQPKWSLPLKPIIFGSLFAVITVLILTTIITLLTEFGWKVTVNWSSNLYALSGYIAIIAGSIAGGCKAGERGWLTGFGVGMISSLILLLMVIFAGTVIQWGIYLVKMLVADFIGIFGGVIGVNLSGQFSRN